jgi:molybdopterin converting factor subunit 1
MLLEDEYKKMRPGGRRITTLYFAQIREAAETASDEFVLPPDSTMTTEDLFLKVIEMHPQIRQLSDSIQISVNRKIVQANIVLNDGDEVAFLPPVMGG